MGSFSKNINILLRRAKPLSKKVAGDVGGLGKRIVSKTGYFEKNKTKDESQNFTTDSTVEEDSVSQDFKKANDLISRVVGKLKGLLKPYALEVSKVSSEKVSEMKSKVRFGTKTLKIAIGVSVFILVMLGLVYAATFFVRKSAGVEKKSVDTVIVATPTPLAYKPYKPSVYAQDEDMLKIQEDLGILKHEISGTNIRVGVLDPPGLDFEVSF